MVRERFCSWSNNLLLIVLAQRVSGVGSMHWYANCFVPRLVKKNPMVVLAQRVSGALFWFGIVDLECICASGAEEGNQIYV